MASDDAHLKYVGYLIETLRSNGNKPIAPDDLPEALKHHFGVDVTPHDLTRARQAIAPLIVETRKGLQLSPLVTIENRSTYYSSRAKLNPAPKRSVAMHIYEDILEELDSVFMDAGSANGAIAEEMAYGDKRNFTVLTNNVRAVRIFLANQTIRTFVTGGVYDVEDEALVGDRALFEWREFGCKTALVGVSALSTHYVYSHGLTGEERIKSHYWQIPADHLVVPATLGKLKGQDASRFGRLFRQRKNDEQPQAKQNTASMDVIGRMAHDKWLNDPYDPSDAPGFRAKRCTIVIEPLWMIDQLYDDDDLKAELMGAVERIQSERARTSVDIVHSNVSEQQFFQHYPALREHFGRTGRLRRMANYAR